MDLDLLLFKVCTNTIDMLQNSIWPVVDHEQLEWHPHVLHQACLGLLSDLAAVYLHKLKCDHGMSIEYRMSTSGQLKHRHTGFNITVFLLHPHLLKQPLPGCVGTGFLPSILILIPLRYLWINQLRSQLVQMVIVCALHCRIKLRELFQLALPPFLPKKVGIAN